MLLLIFWLTLLLFNPKLLKSKLLLELVLVIFVLGLLLLTEGFKKSRSYSLFKSIFLFWFKPGLPNPMSFEFPKLLITWLLFILLVLGKSFNRLSKILLLLFAGLLLNLMELKLLFDIFLFSESMKSKLKADKSDFFSFSFGLFNLNLFSWDPLNKLLLERGLFLSSIPSKIDFGLSFAFFVASSKLLVIKSISDPLLLLFELKWFRFGDLFAFWVLVCFPPKNESKKDKSFPSALLIEELILLE